MTRREVREKTFALLFRAEFHDAIEMKEQTTLFEDEHFMMLPKAAEEDAEPVVSEDGIYVESKVSDILTKLAELDELINGASKGWKTSRMGKVDLTVLRLALYEIKFEPEIPVKVSINEAVELAKRYGTNESGSFVNGVLSKFAAEA